MIRLKIERRYPKEKYTIGWWYINGQRFYNSLEDPDRGLTKDMPLREIVKKKVHGNTAIPKGSYYVVLSFSQKFQSRPWAKKYKGLVPEILGVPGYSGIRIHPGTDASSTEGCPLIGDNTAKGKLTNSQKRYYELMDILVPASMAGEAIRIDIV